MKNEENLFCDSRELYQVQITHLPIGTYDFIIYHTGHLDENDLGFWHHHSCFELYFVEDGRLNIKFGSGDEETLRQGDLLLLPPETSHYVELSSEGKKSLFSLLFKLNLMKHGPSGSDRRTIEAAAIDRIFREATSSSYLLYPTDEKASHVLNALFHEIAIEVSAKTFGWNIALNILCLRVIILAARQIPSAPDQGVGSDEKSNLAIRCIDYIRVHYAEDISIETLAADLYISPRHVNRVLNKMFNTTFGDILRRFRLDTAKKLLQTTDLTIDEVAESVGIGSAQALSKLFREVDNQSPEDQRKR